MGQRNVWTTEGQIFVKIRGSVKKVRMDNRTEVLREAREARESSADCEDAANSDVSPMRAGSDSRVTPRGPRGYGRGSPVGSTGSVWDSGARGRGRGKNT